MNDEIFSVFDACARRYLEPFFSQTVETALRGFREVCNREDHQFFRHREDYILYHIGNFDAEFGTITSFTEPRKVAMAVQMIQEHATQLDLVDQIEAEKHA